MTIDDAAGAHAGARARPRSGHSRVPVRQMLDRGRRSSAIWSFREAALGLSTAMKADGKAISFVEDTAVAPEKLRDYIERLRRAS